MKKILLIGLFLITGCDDENYINIPNGYACRNFHYQEGNQCHKKYIYKNVCEQEKLANFIINCAKAANPLSDEEGEDLVYECAKQGNNIYCHQEYFLNNTKNLTNAK